MGRLTALLAMWGLATILAGCGGGGGPQSPPPPPPSPPPVVAQAQDDNFTVAWARSTSLQVLGNDSVSAGTATLTIPTEPVHGRTTVQGTAVQYTPDAGFYGEDQFSYRVELGSASSVAIVRVKVEAEIELSGSTMPIASASMEVTAQVGDQQFKTTTDATGAYKLSVKSSRAESFIALTARGSGAQSHWVLASQVADFGTLLAVSSASQIGEASWPALRLDVLSTARQGLLQQQGSLPTTGAALRDALARQEPRDLIDIATLLRHILVDGAALPDGTANTAELAGKPSALAALQQQWRATGNGLSSIEFDITLNQIASASPVPVATQGSRLAVLPPADEYADLLEPVLDLRPDGSATGFVTGTGFSGKFASRVNGATWSRDGNALTITFTSGLALGMQRPSILGFQFRQIRSADNLPSRLLMMRQLTRSSAPCDPTGCAAPSYSRWVAALGYDIERDRQALRSEDFAAGTHWGGLSIDARISYATCLCLAQEFSFDGSPTVSGYSGQLVDGQWRLSSSTNAYRYTRLGEIGDAVEYWLAEIESGGVQIHARLLPVVKGGAVQLDLSAAARRWDTERSPAGSDPASAHVQQYPSNLYRSGRMTSGGLNGQSTADYGYLWTLSGDGRVVTIKNGDTLVSETTFLRAVAGGGYLAMRAGLLIRLRDLGSAD